MRCMGKLIRSYRVKKQMTVQDVAAALGVNERLVTKWETGRAMPDAPMIEQLSTLLEIPTGAWISTTMHGLQCQRRSLLITVLALLLAVLLALGGIGMYARQILERMEYVLYGGFGSLASNYAVSVSMTELIATPERYHGVKVRLTAVGNLEFEGNYITTDKEAWENYTNDRIWIELSEELEPYYERLQRYNGEYVIIEGVFDMYDKGHFEMFQGALHDVDRYEFSSAHLYNNYEFIYYNDNDQPGHTHYTVYDNNGKVLAAGDIMGFYPQTRYVGVNVLGMFLEKSEFYYDNQAVYFDVEKSIVSEQFSHVIEAQDRYVAYVIESAGQYSLVVQDIFDAKAYYQTYPLDQFDPDSERPITSQKDDVSGKLQITYKSGEGGEEKTLTIYLP